MKQLHYCGFGAWCAAYAFLNTTQCFRVTPEVYELLSGVPFGIAFHMRCPSRIFVPFAEPCNEVETVAKVLGYKATAGRYNDISSAVDFLSGLPPHSKVMIGPINMGFLDYLPQNIFYMNQSHYISVNKQEDGKYRITDSESTLAVSCTSERLKKIVSPKDIPEANGTIHVWQFKGAGDGRSKEEFISIIKGVAYENLSKAEKAGHGSLAVKRCAEFLSAADIKGRQLKICYDINYLLQRKLLAEGCCAIWSADQKKIIAKQIDILCILRGDIMAGRSVNTNLLLRFADLEYDLAVSTERQRG